MTISDTPGDGLVERLKKIASERHTISHDEYGARKALLVMNKLSAALDEAIAALSRATEAPLARQHGDGVLIGQKFYDENGRITVVGYDHSAQKEIERLNEELLCASEAFAALSSEKTKPDEVDRFLDFILSDDSPVTDEDRPAIEAFDKAVEEAKAKLRADLHGPYGWLIMPEGLSEDAWYLADQPEPGVPSEPLYSRHPLPSKED